MAIPAVLSEVPNQTPYIQYVATNGQTVFPYPFAITQDSDLVVVVNGVTLNTDTGYALSGQGNDTGGNLTFTLGQASGAIITLFRDIVIERLTQFSQNGGFSSAAFNAEFNNLYLIAQQLEASVAQCLQIPNTNNPAPATTLTPANYANKYLSFDSHGNPQPAALTSSGSLTAAIIGNLLFKQTLLEANAGVVPVDFTVNPYIVTRYGAKGDGVTDDTAAFNTAGSIGVDIGVPETKSTYVLSSQVTGVFYAIGQPRFATTYQRIGLVSQTGTMLTENNSGVIGAFPRDASILVIGDSITEGTGASVYANSWSWLAGRSIMNAADEGIFRDAGFGYHSILNMFRDLPLSPGVTCTGTLSTNGVMGQRVLLTSSAQGLQFTEREVTAVAVYYNASASSGQFNISLNGSPVSTVTVAGSGLVSTGFVFLKTNALLTRLSDLITVSPVGSGHVELCAVILAKNSVANACIMHVAALSGTTYQNWNTVPDIAELAFYLNATTELGGSQTKVLVLNLGTNSMYNATNATSPAVMVTNLATLLTGLVGLCPNLQIAVSIPPKSNEAIFPVILTQYKYEDYRRALISYCVSGNITMIRHDLGALSSGAYYADGLHPNDPGHTIFAQTTLKALGVKFDGYFKSTATALQDYLTFLRTDAVIAMNSTWGAFSASTTYAGRAHIVAGDVRLSGVVIPNGSVSATVGTLPAGYQPDNGNRYFTVPTNVTGGTKGVARLTINSSGQLILDAVPTNDVALDGVAFPIYKYIES